MELTGKITKMLDAVSGQGNNGKAWTKQEFLIKTNDDYAKTVCFCAWGEKINLIKDFKPTDEIKDYFDLESREYKGRYFTEARIWKAELLSPAHGEIKNNDVNFNGGNFDLPENEYSGTDVLPF
jgi:hypothetical protein